MTPSHSTWRLLRTEPASGAWNMAVDEVVLHSAGRGESLPTLRVYPWDRPCISLGFAQQASDIDEARRTALGWDLVRRPTGGRAVLHVDELTYAVIGPAAEPRLGAGILESYLAMAQALAGAVAALGVTAAYQPSYPLPEGAVPGGPVCFEVPSSYEIMAGGKKLIGSAQARRRDGILQQGSLPLYGDITRLAQALALPGEAERQAAAERIDRLATTVERCTGRRVSWEDAADAFARGFGAALNLSFVEEGLTRTEIEAAALLEKTKYGADSWTYRI